MPTSRTENGNAGPASAELAPVPHLPSAVREALKRLLVEPYRWGVRRNRLKFLFLAGHLRSGSTLLLHLLNSNPGICGYGETHRYYRRERDLALLSLDVSYWLRRFHVVGKYIMDKVLFDYLRSRDVIRHRTVRLIFLLRRPVEALSSIMHFRPRFETWDESRALEYYCRQLDVLVEYARTKKDPSSCFVLTYGQLVDRTDNTLAALTRFLDLDEPLTDRYETIFSTGRRGFGDDSKRISEGRIVRTRRRTAPMPSGEVLAEARSVFRRSRSSLLRLCSSVGASARLGREQV